MTDNLNPDFEKLVLTYLEDYKRNIRSISTWVTILAVMVIGVAVLGGCSFVMGLLS